MGDTKIMLHSGGWDATIGEVRAVPVPEPTATWHPIGHEELVEKVLYELPRFQLENAGTKLALANEGNRFFGLVKCARMSDRSDYGLVIGIRNSYDKSFATELCAGTQVFICDNLSFHGESMMRRKHTSNLHRDLPVIIYQLLGDLQHTVARTDSEIATWKAAKLDGTVRDHVLVEAARRRAIPWSAMPKVLEIHHEDDRFEKDSVWSFFNAFTSWAKERSPAQQMNETLRLSGLFREVWQPEMGYVMPAEVVPQNS